MTGLAKRQFLQATLSLCFAPSGVHILEKFAFDWKSWAQNVLNLSAHWSDFYVTNCLVIALGIAAAQIRLIWPALTMVFQALMIINALLFHVTPFVWTKGRFSPGLITETSNRTSQYTYSGFKKIIAAVLGTLFYGRVYSQT